MTLTCCQDHILTGNIWFVWSKTSWEEVLPNNEQTVKIELLSQWKLEAEFRKNRSNLETKLFINVIRALRVSSVIHFSSPSCQRQVSCIQEQEMLRRPSLLPQSCRLASPSGFYDTLVFIFVNAQITRLSLCSMFFVIFRNHISQFFRGSMGRRSTPWTRWLFSSLCHSSSSSSSLTKGSGQSSGLLK